MTLRIMGPFATLSIKTFCIECHYAKCNYAPNFIYCYAECRYAECRYAKFRYGECRYAECHSAL